MATLTLYNDLQSHRADILKHLGQMLQDVEALKKGLFPTPELQNLGFRPRQIDLEDELDFSPCFFKPLVASIIDEYPLADNGLGSMAGEHFTPQEESTLEVTRGLFEQVQGLVIEPREGLYLVPDKYPWGLDYFASLQRVHADRDRRDPRDDLELEQTSGPWYWESGEEYGSPDYPHIVVCMFHDLDGTDQALAIGELQAILKVLQFRYKRRDYIFHSIMPHGRILQAHYDGESKNIVVQYSPLMSFEVESQGDEAAPVRLFARYEVSRPVGSTIKED
ncbi:uncharacterized protein LDX57_011702 [Aspergillus melleus]|uniref:uncharacterized protein n=1 Tax=Aspergillus melleus TaxID=138277 RepID=UPI001E8ECD09|nr:uncharacterized protein LDX57_011702 [Aspergillus melleus]KAH8434065.1 hypothetical protein LDX57_011702 [Aspergillus melleus]